MTAYWIAHVTVTDPETYKGYQERAARVFADHGASFLARGGEAEVLEGPVLQRHVIIRFPSLDQARACYRSEAYQEACRFRREAAIAHVTIVEGL
jgi:uncharacterized protein (DUF1330 family)